MLVLLPALRANRLNDFGRDFIYTNELLHIARIILSGPRHGLLVEISDDIVVRPFTLFVVIGTADDITKTPVIL